MYLVIHRLDTTDPCVPQKILSKAAVVRSISLTQSFVCKVIYEH